MVPKLLSCEVKQASRVHIQGFICEFLDVQSNVSRFTIDVFFYCCHHLDDRYLFNVLSNMKIPNCISGQCSSHVTFLRSPLPRTQGSHCIIVTALWHKNYREFMFDNLRLMCPGFRHINFLLDAFPSKSCFHLAF